MNLKNILRIILGMILISFSYACFNIPNEIINGGVTSFSLIIQNYLPFRIDLISNFFTILLLVICFMFLGKDYFLNSLLGSLVYMVLFSYFVSLNIELEIPILIVIILSSICVGVGYYLCIISKASTIGFDVIALIVNKKNNELSIGKIMRVINIVIIIGGGALYGIRSVVDGLLFSCMQSYILDYLLAKHKGKEKNL